MLSLYFGFTIWLAVCLALGATHGAIGVLGFMAGCAAAWGLASWWGRARFRRLARKLGIEWLGGRRAGGEVEGLQVELSKIWSLSWTTMRKVTVRVRSHTVSSRLSVRPAGRLLSPSGLVTGDEAFDERFVVEGEPVSIAAALGPQARALLLQLFSRGVSGKLDKGELELTRNFEDRVQRLVERTRSAVGAMQAATAPDNAARLQQLVTSEETDDGAVRKQIVVLAEAFPSDETQRALLSAVNRQDLSDPTRAVALDALFEALGTDLEPLRDRAEELFAQEGPALRATVLRALPRLRPGQDVEEVLLSSLGEESEDLERVAAAETLAEVGSLRAVHPLLEAGEGLLTDRDLKDAVQAAVHAIQDRAGGGERGGLAMVEGLDGEGGLAVAPQEAGELSVAD